MSVRPVPDGYHTVTPYLTIRGATELLQFVKDAFEAVETECMRSPDGRVQHAHVKIGDSNVMLGEAPEDFQPMPCTLYLYVDDVDGWFERAVRAGGEVLEQPEEKFYGDRTAAVKDASGNRWYMATHIEDVLPRTPLSGVDEPPARDPRPRASESTGPIPFPPPIPRRSSTCERDLHKTATTGTTMSATSSEVRRPQRSIRSLGSELDDDVRHRRRMPATRRLVVHLAR